MAAVLSCTILMATLMLVDLPILHQIFNPWAPTISDHFR
jgi:hypothetical protein